MPKKSDDRLAAIRAQAANLRRRAPEEPPPREDADLDVSSHFGIPILDQLAAGRSIQRLPIGHIAPDLRPDSRQPRLLPPPEDLLVGGEAAPGYESLVAELRELGESLRERQIQPIVIYSGTSAHYPAARYLILVGHRRWTAAFLVGLSDLDTIIVEPPTPTERIMLQYSENEQRADFTDMERAWALQQMKQALDDAPWEQVETRFRMSTSRRHELTRLLAFTPRQQQTIAHLRLRENQIEPLHQAVRAGTLPITQVDAVLNQIERHAQALGTPIDGMTIARLVSQAKRSAGVVPARPPQWFTPLRLKITALKKDTKRLRLRMGELNDTDRAQLLAELGDLVTVLRGTITELGGEDNPTE